MSTQTNMQFRAAEALEALWRTPADRTPPQEFLSVLQVARVLMISRVGVWRLVRSGLLRAYRGGLGGRGRVLIRLEDVRAFVDSRPIRATGQLPPSAGRRRTRRTF